MQKANMRILIAIFTLFSTTFSQTTVNKASTCGQKFFGNVGSIKSPNFSDGAYYPPNTYCEWEIIVPENQQVQFMLNSIDIEYGPPDCTFDGLVLHDVTEGFTLNVSDARQTSRFIGKTRFCGDLPFGEVRSRTNRVQVAFYSDDDTEGQGFNLLWNAVDRVPDQFDCDFQQGVCDGWENLGHPDDMFDWEIKESGTRTTLTGPTFDHTLQNAIGKFAFIEASLPRRPNEEAILVTPAKAFNASYGEMCLRFWYHMYGGDIGTLRVAILVGKTSTISWFKTGDQGQRWIEGRLTIPHQYEPFRIMFIGVRGRGHEGDIALDDVTIVDGSCTSISTQETPEVNSSIVTATSTAATIVPQATCNQYEYACISGYSCIPKFYVCDGMMDCPDNDDENDCEDYDKLVPPILTDDLTTVESITNWSSPPATSEPSTSNTQGTACPDDYAPCLAGNCIPAFWICDGEDDCPDGGDELDCPGEATTAGWDDYGLYENFTDVMVVDNTTTRTQATTQTVMVTETQEPSTEATSTTRMPAVSIESSTTTLASSTFSSTTAEAITTSTAASTVEATESTSVAQTQTTTTVPTTPKASTQFVDVSAASQTTDVTAEKETVVITTTTVAETTSTSETTPVEVATPHDVTTESDETTSDVKTDDATSIFTPRPASTTTTTRKPVSTPKLLTRDTKAPARFGGEGGAASVRSQSLFVLLLQTLGTLMVAMVLSCWR